jgi:hypothetical protein
LPAAQHRRFAVEGELEQPVDRMAAPQQPAGEIRSVLSGNACDGGAFHSG